MKTLEDKDLDIMARTIYGEARGELNHPDGGIKSLHAVGWVIKNRTKMPQYSAYVHEVCMQPWQFSCWNINDVNRLKLLKADLNDKIYRKCYLAATEVLFGRIPDCTHGANHYHSTDIPPPYWAKGQDPTAKIGRHVFYKLGK